MQDGAQWEAFGVARRFGWPLAPYWASAPALGRCYFKPSAACQVIMNDTRARKSLVDRSEVPRPGYLVFYYWGDRDHAEHIGIVERADGGPFDTIASNITAIDGPN